MTYTFGIEIETAGVSISRIQNAFDRAGIKGCDVKPDGTPNVDAEIVLPPLGDCQVAKEYLQSISNVLLNVGADVNRSCGLHIHISNAPLNDDTTPVTYTGDSIRHFQNTGRFLSQHGEPMDAVIVKDIMQRYERQQTAINRMFPNSRTNNRYCHPLQANRIERPQN